MIVVLSPFICNLTKCNPPNIAGLLVLYMRIFIVYASRSNLLSLDLERYIAVKPLKYLTFITRRRVTQMVVISKGIPRLVIVVAVSIDRILNAEEVPSMFPFLLSAYHLCLSMLSFVLFSFFAFCLRC